MGVATSWGCQWGFSSPNSELGTLYLFLLTASLVYDANHIKNVLVPFVWKLKYKIINMLLYEWGTNYNWISIFSQKIWQGIHYN